MTVKNHKEAECATASEDMEVDNNILEMGHHADHQESEEALLGRVLAGNYLHIGFAPQAQYTTEIPMY